MLPISDSPVHKPMGVVQKSFTWLNGYHLIAFSDNVGRNMLTNGSSSEHAHILRVDYQIGAPVGQCADDCRTHS